MSESLGEEICERIRVEIATGRVLPSTADRIMVPRFGFIQNGNPISLEDAKRKLWTPYGCLWVGEEVEI